MVCLWTKSAMRRDQSPGSIRCGSCSGRRQYRLWRNGNTGYGAMAAQQRTTNAGMQVTINDPGNAELAITVGSTHREMPHVYGVSYFSSKGPTGDGRMKPDVV